jgi:hypothetical protein
MNNLKNTRCYLAGAIENDVNLGRGWRDKVKGDLGGLGIHWLDPSRKPTASGQETPETAKRLRDQRADRQYETIRSAMGCIRSVDLRLVTISDFIIAKVNPLVPTFGTHEELALAATQKKPIFVVIEGGLTVAPMWWFDMLPSGSMFDDWDDLYRSLEVVNEESHGRFSEHWIFFDWMGDNEK